MSRIALLGSGNVLIKLIPFIFNNNLYDEVLVGYAPRHESSICDSGKTFEEELKVLNNAYKNLFLYKIRSLDEENFDILCDSDLQISLGSPWIFKDRHIKKASYLVHSHSTDLPKFRGGASYSWMIMSRYRKSSITIYRMNEFIDSGDLIQKDDFEFPSIFTKPQEYILYAEKLILESLMKFISNFHISGKTLPEIKQNEAISTYFPRLSSDIHSWINWNWSCEDLVSFIRAFGEPYNGAKTRISSNHDDVLRIKSANVYKNDGKFHPFKNGIIYRIYEKRIYVVAAPYSLELTDFFEVNKEVAIKQGDRFFNFSNDLDSANSKRIYFYPN